MNRNMNMNTHSSGRKATIGLVSSRGATLILSLVLLSIVAVSALGGLENVRLQEKMATNSYDRSLGLHGAELAISLGEEQAEAQALVLNADFPQYDTSGTPGVNFNNCTTGLCVTPDAADTPRWESDQFSGWQAVSGLSDPRMGSPEYFVEFLGNTYPCTTNHNGPQTCSRYRITGRSGMGAGRSQVMIQTVFATQ